MDLLKILDSKPAPEIVNKNFLTISGDTSGDYWLPTTMSLYQKELTDQIVSLHYSDILRYFETDDYKEDVVLKSLETMCLNSQLVATHPFLLIDHYLPKSLITKDVPTHLAENSGKFSVLRDLVNILQDYETDTAIICRPGRSMNLLEALLLGAKVNIKRYDGNSVKSKQKSRNLASTFHLFPSDNINFKKYPILIENAFNMVIALDPSVNSNHPDTQSVIRHARNGSDIPSKAPIVRMVSINTVDHCDLYFSHKFEKGSREFLTYVTAAVVVLRDRVGVLPPDLRPIYSHKLKYLIDWLEDALLPWPLPDLYPIKKYTPMDVERSLLMEFQYSQHDDSLESAFSNNKKRGIAAVDRDVSKESEVKSFYNKKRVQNDYSTNPLRQDMSQLTGITTGNDLKGIDYHLSSGILTHKLIQYINEFYVDITILNSELKDYDDVEPIQENHAQDLEKDKSELQTKIDNLQKENENNLTIIDGLENENKIHFDSIGKLEKDIETQLHELSEKSDDYKSLKDLYVQSQLIEQDLLKEQRLSESKQTEKEYMLKEISRAELSIKENEEEIKSVTIEVSELKNKLKFDFDEFKNKKDEVSTRVEILKDHITKEQKLNEELEVKLLATLENLGNLPTPRIRTTNGSSTSNGRKYKGRKK